MHTRGFDESYLLKNITIMHSCNICECTATAIDNYMAIRYNTLSFSMMKSVKVNKDRRIREVTYECSN
jgi:hypothetical protein